MRDKHHILQNKHREIDVGVEMWSLMRSKGLCSLTDWLTG